MAPEIGERQLLPGVSFQREVGRAQQLCHLVSGLGSRQTNPELCSCQFLCFFCRAVEPGRTRVHRRAASEQRVAKVTGSAPSRSRRRSEQAR